MNLRLPNSCSRSWVTASFAIEFFKAVLNFCLPLTEGMFHWGLPVKHSAWLVYFLRTTMKKNMNIYITDYAGNTINYKYENSFRIFLIVAIYCVVARHKEKCCTCKEISSDWFENKIINDE